MPALSFKAAFLDDLLSGRKQQTTRMIRRWVKLLPYWFVVWCIRHTGASFGTLNIGKEYNVRYFQVDRGEFVVFSEEVHTVFRKRQEAKKKNKSKKKLMRINRIIAGDFETRNALEEQVVREINEKMERRNEDDE